jgi:hypothetical protein
MSTLSTYNVKNPDSASANLQLDSNGNVAIQAGSASAPSLYLTGDSNTGLSGPAADTLAVSTGGSERCRVDSSGNLLVGLSSANANGGILQLSGGITFPATAVGATDANTLDDYEEGTWTPALKFGGNSVSMTGSYAGKYVKTGKVVYYSASISLTAKGSSTGNTTITGLPFTNASGGNENYATTIAFMYNGASLTGPLMPRVGIGSTTIDVFQNSAIGYATVSQANFNNDSQVQIFGFYFV